MKTVVTFYWGQAAGGVRKMEFDSKESAISWLKENGVELQSTHYENEYNWHHTSPHTYIPVIIENDTRG